MQAYFAIKLKLELQAWRQLNLTFGLNLKSPGLVRWHGNPQGPPNNFFFFLENASFRLIMENNFIQMIDPVFKHIIDCVQPYFINDFTNIVL